MITPMDSNFDWVTALDRCSPNAVFEQLRLQVEKDVEIRNGLMSEHGRMHNPFTMITNGGKFTVLIERGADHRRVTFRLVKKGIEVRDQDDRIIIEVTLILNGKGECKPEIGGKEYEFWQLRMMALKELFTLS